MQEISFFYAFAAKFVFWTSGWGMVCVNSCQIGYGVNTSIHLHHSAQIIIKAQTKRKEKYMAVVTVPKLTYFNIYDLAMMHVNYPSFRGKRYYRQTEIKQPISLIQSVFACIN